MPNVQVSESELSVSPIQWWWFHFERWCHTRVMGGVTSLHTNFHRAINKDRSAHYVPLSLVQGSLESAFTSLLCDAGFISQFKVVHEIQLVL